MQVYTILLAIPSRMDRTYVLDYLTAIDACLDSPSTIDELHRWKEETAQIAGYYTFEPIEQDVIARICSMLYEQYERTLLLKDSTDHLKDSTDHLKDSTDHLKDSTVPTDPMVYGVGPSSLGPVYGSGPSALWARHARSALPSPAGDPIEELLQRKQTEQRTPEWYQQMGEMISASELGSLYSTPYARGKMVMAKTLPYEPRNQSLAVSSERMSPFDWGIRFEPVVKQIYEYRYGATIKELGRMIHPTEPRCAASPDGLVYSVGAMSPEKRGRLIEIKCPVTRVIDGTIPKDYVLQMQMQMHVTGRTECDYVEAAFGSPYNAPVDAARYTRIGPGQYTGWIALIYSFETGTYRYEYSPVNASADWTPTYNRVEMKMEDGDGSMACVEQVIERIPWRLLQWREQVVTRSEEWWATFQPMIREFWQDVDRAKRGEFIPPESSRASKKSIPSKGNGKSKGSMCHITFHKAEEDTADASESHASESHASESHAPESHAPESHASESHAPESHASESHAPESHA